MDRGHLRAGGTVAIVGSAAAAFTQPEIRGRGGAGFPRSLGAVLRAGAMTEGNRRIQVFPAAGRVPGCAATGEAGHIVPAATQALAAAATAAAPRG